MLLDILAQSQQQGGGGFAPPSAMPQGMPMGQEQMPPQMMQQPAPMTSPFDIGISRALQSSRAALQMAPDQEGRALRKAMMGYGESIGAQPKVRGFMNNLGQGLKALGAGVGAHDEAEAAAQLENQAMAEKLIAHQMAKRDYEDKMAQQTLNNDFRERQLGEMKRAHNLMHRASTAENDEGGLSNKSESKILERQAIENHKANNAYIKETRPQIEQDEIKKQVYDKMADIIKKEPAVGGTALSAIDRWVKKQAGKDKNLTELQMYKKYFFKDIKGVAGNPAVREWIDIMKTMVDEDKNPEGQLEFINTEKDMIDKKLKKYNARRKVLSDTKNRLHYESQEVNDLIDKELGIPKAVPLAATTSAAPVKQIKIRDKKTGAIEEIDEDLLPQLNADLIEVMQ